MNKILEQHRNLYNGDSCVFFYNPEKWQPEGGPYSARAIHRYVDCLADHGIDTFIINGTAQRAWYPSKVMPNILEGYARGDREHFRAHAICAGLTEPAEIERYLDNSVKFFGLYLDLIEAGVDWLAETAAACRRRGVAPWTSVRMNDMHGHRNVQGSFFNLPLFKDERMRLKRSGELPTLPEPSNRAGLNYERREVRDLMMTQIREVVEDYDFEGLELDWWRQPLCCEPDATPQTVAMMSDWFRDIRALTARRAQATGRPYYFGMRIPGRLETLKSIGLDIAGLCRDGTLDFISPSGYWRTTWDMPHDRLREQVGDRVAIYGVIEDGANALPTLAPALNKTMEIRFTSSSREMLHANAAGKLALGADGIEWFNHFCTDQARLPGLISDYASLRQIHDREFLRGREKHYTFANQSGSHSFVPFEASPQVPAVLEPGWEQAFRLPMGAEPDDGALELVIQVVLRAGDSFASLPVSFNGCWPKLEHTRTDRLLFPCGPLTHHVPAHVGCDYTFPVALIREGWNEITVQNGGTGAIQVVCVELAVKRKGSPAP